jgi:hypothetical protein
VSWKNALIAALTLGLVAALALPAGADRDDTMVVGRANGAKGYNTSLYSTNPTATLTVVSNRTGGAPALDLQVRAGPALAVNTSARVPKLNADYVDGYQANMLSRIAECGTDDANNGYYSCVMNMDLPRPGHVLLIGSAETWTATTGIDAFWCDFSVLPAGDSAWTYLPESARRIEINGNDGAVDNNCVTNTVYSVDEAGYYYFRFRLYSVDADVTVIDGVSASALFTPFDGNGN